MEDSYSKLLDTKLNEVKKTVFESIEKGLMNSE
jgi:hypothetical protein